MKRQAIPWLSVIGIVAVLCVFWKPLLWLAAILLIVLALFIGRILWESVSIKRRIERDPDGYFASSAPQTSHDDNVIEAEYTEQEVMPDERH